MILVVEKGQGLPNANSYIDDGDVMDNLPFSAMDMWQGLTQDEQTDRLVIASQFIDSSFSWIGKQKTLEQGLSWPRVGVMWQGFCIPDDSIPRPIRQACIMALYLIISQGLDIFRDTGDAEVKMEALGSLKTEYFERIKGMAANGTNFNDINRLLKGFYAEVSGDYLVSEVIRK